MSIEPKLFVIIGIFSTASAQIFLKRANVYEILKIKWLSCITISLLSYCIAFIAYYMALRDYDISKVSPIIMSSVLSLIALYGFLVGERLTCLRLFGIILAITSVWFISKS